MTRPAHIGAYRRRAPTRVDLPSEPEPRPRPRTVFAPTDPDACQALLAILLKHGEGCGLIRRAEDMAIAAALEVNEGEQLGAARLLGMSPMTLNRRLARRGVRPKDKAARAVNR